MEKINSVVKNKNVYAKQVENDEWMKRIKGKLDGMKKYEKDFPRHLRKLERENTNSHKNYTKIKNDLV